MNRRCKDYWTEQNRKCQVYCETNAQRSNIENNWTIQMSLNGLPTYKRETQVGKTMHTQKETHRHTVTDTHTSTRRLIHIKS